MRFADGLDGQSVVIACTLDRPDAKIAGLLFAADAARELGAKRVGLAAPYLCYMRQDRRFQPGEAVTSRSFAALISRHFDWLVTVDPHLHRYRALNEIYSIPALALHAGPVIADWIMQNVTKPYLIGPDRESSQWIEAVAGACGAPWAVLTKTRTGDRSVSETALSVPLAGRTSSSCWMISFQVARLSRRRSGNCRPTPSQPSPSRSMPYAATTYGEV